jgi:hypothetical protein
MLYTLNIYRPDKRTKTGERLVGTYEYDRKNDDQMEHQVKELRLIGLYPEKKFRIEFFPKDQ